MPCYSSTKHFFSKELGEIHPFTASLPIKSDATPRFFKPRPVPFAIKDAISQELTRLEHQGTISPVKHSQWATPIVPVPKKDGKFRICGDYKVTLNQVLLVEEYPLPTPEELFSTLAGGKIFSKLDLSQAYLHLPVEKESKKYVPNYQYTPRAVCIQPSAIWSSFRSCHLPKTNGHSVTRYCRSDLLH